MFYVAKCATVGLMYAHKHVGDFSIFGGTKFGLECNGFRYEHGWVWHKKKIIKYIKDHHQLCSSLNIHQENLTFNMPFIKKRAKMNE